MIRRFLLLLLLTPFLLFAETVGKRPYELDWAGRTTDTYPDAVLADFESDGWTGECEGGTIAVERTREQQLFGDYVLKATYCNTAENSQIYYIRPPEPLATPEEFDTITLWVYGNQEAIDKDRATIGPVCINVQLRNAEGNAVDIELYNVDWDEWFLCHKRLTPEQQEERALRGTLYAMGSRRSSRNCSRVPAPRSRQSCSSLRTTANPARFSSTASASTRTSSGR